MGLEPDHPNLRLMWMPSIVCFWTIAADPDRARPLVAFLSLCPCSKRRVGGVYFAIHHSAIASIADHPIMAQQGTPRINGHTDLRDSAGLGYPQDSARYHSLLRLLPWRDHLPASSASSYSTVRFGKLLIAMPRPEDRVTLFFRL